MLRSRYNAAGCVNTMCTIRTFAVGGGVQNFEAIKLVKFGVS
jgi:predicted phage gp36 major capsid-like protein